MTLIDTLDFDSCWVKIYNISHFKNRTKIDIFAMISTLKYKNCIVLHNIVLCCTIYTNRKYYKCVELHSLGTGWLSTS